MSKTPDKQELPLETSPYTKYEDIEDYKKNAYGTSVTNRLSMAKVVAQRTHRPSRAVLLHPLLIQLTNKLRSESHSVITKQNKYVSIASVLFTIQCDLFDAL
ncbi:unnamed protein product [Brassica oleracea]